MKTFQSDRDAHARRAECQSNNISVIILCSPTPNIQATHDIDLKRDEEDKGVKKFGQIVGTSTEGRARTLQSFHKAVVMVV